MLWSRAPRGSSASQLCLLSPENPICPMRAVRTMTTSVRSRPKKSDAYDVCRPYDDDQCAQSPKKIRCVRCVPSVRWRPVCAVAQKIRCVRCVPSIRCGLVCAYLNSSFIVYFPISFELKQWSDCSFLSQKLTLV